MPGIVYPMVYFTLIVLKVAVLTFMALLLLNLTNGMAQQTGSLSSRPDNSRQLHATDRVANGMVYEPYPESSRALESIFDIPDKLDGLFPYDLRPGTRARAKREEKQVNATEEAVSPATEEEINRIIHEEIQRLEAGRNYKEGDDAIASLDTVSESKKGDVEHLVEMQPVVQQQEVEPSPIVREKSTVDQVAKIPTNKTVEQTNRDEQSKRATNCGLSVTLGISKVEAKGTVDRAAADTLEDAVDVDPIGDKGPHARDVDFDDLENDELIRPNPPRPEALGCGLAPAGLYTHYSVDDILEGANTLLVETTELSSPEHGLTEQEMLSLLSLSNTLAGAFQLSQPVKYPSIQIAKFAVSRADRVTQQKGAVIRSLSNSERAILSSTIPGTLQRMDANNRILAFLTAKWQEQVDLLFDIDAKMTKVSGKQTDKFIATLQERMREVGFVNGPYKWPIWHIAKYLNIFVRENTLIARNLYALLNTDIRSDPTRISILDQIFSNFTIFLTKLDIFTESKCLDTFGFIYHEYGQFPSKGGDAASFE